MKRARITLEGAPREATVDGDELALDDGTRVPMAEASWLAPVVPRTIVATHLSYRSRCEEYAMAAPPRYPSYFLKPLSARSRTTERTWPGLRGCEYLNYEGEIAAVIGRLCQGVSRAEALDHVVGYTIANDFGVHDFRHIDRGSMLRVKGQDGFCPLGPVMVDAADVDPADLTLRTYVNGEVVQEANTGDDLLFGVDYQVADVSRLITLEPGDLILTGTPANSRPVQPGDLVEVEVEGIGRLGNTSSSSTATSRMSAPLPR